METNKRLEEAERLLKWAAEFVEKKIYPSDNWYAEYELYREISND